MLCKNISFLGCMVMMMVVSCPTTATFPNECPSRSIESRLGSMEERLAAIQTIVSTLDDPLVEDNCVVYLAASGFDDSTRESYVKTSTASSDVIAWDRGVTLVELDATKCSTKNKETFDTHPYANADTAQLLEALESAAAGTLIAGVTEDAPESGNGDLQKSVGSFFAIYNMNITGLQPRDKFAFIMQKGYPKKTVFERKTRYGENLKIAIAISGSSIHNMTFSRVVVGL